MVPFGTTQDCSWVSFARPYLCLADKQSPYRREGIHRGIRHRQLLILRWKHLVKSLLHWCLIDWVHPLQCCSPPWCTSIGVRILPEGVSAVLYIPRLYWPDLEWLDSSFGVQFPITLDFWVTQHGKVIGSYSAGMYVLRRAYLRDPDGE